MLLALSVEDWVRATLPFWRSDMAVAIVRNNHRVEALKRAIELSDGFAKLRADHRVLIKPNLVTSGSPSHPRAGMVTSASAVESMVLLLKEFGISKIAIGEGSVVGKGIKTNTQSAFDWSGMSQVAARHDVKLIDFNKGKFEKIPLGDITAKVSCSVFETDFFIDFPVLKTHGLTMISLGAKNLKGCLYLMSKRDFHFNGLSHLIACMANTIPVHLNIIDGLYGLQNGPFGTDVYPFNLLIAGRNLVEVDAVGAWIMGIDPRNVLHLAELAANKGLNLDKDELSVKGLTIQEVQKFLSWQNPWVDNLINQYGVKICITDPGELMCTGCSLTVFFGLKEFFKENQGRSFPHVQICVGRTKAAPESKKVFLLGKCPIDINKDLSGAVKVKGCPPPIKDIVETLNEELKE